MTMRFLEETASTADLVSDAERGSTTRPEQKRAHLQPGLLVAGFLVMAALTAGPGAPSSLTLSDPAYLRRRDSLVASTESGTTEQECDPALLEHIREIFRRSRAEFFEDGMHSAFSRALLAVLAKHGREAFRAVAVYLYSGDADAEVVAEALRWLADFNDVTTLHERWTILQRCLRDQSPRVRDGAILGFAALDDPRARSALEAAKTVEPLGELRRTIDQVIAQLNATANAAASSHRPSSPVA